MAKTKQEWLYQLRRCSSVNTLEKIIYRLVNVNLEHTKTKAMSPQTNGICERFHKTILNEFYQVTFRKKL